MTEVLHTLLTTQAVMQKDLEYLRRDTETVLARFGQHVADAERDGGWHDRMTSVEAAVQALETQRRMDMIMSRWFMLGAAVLASGMVTGAIRMWGVISRIIGA
jgi:hypothetical protein